jgi:hypothetical protein
LAFAGLSVALVNWQPSWGWRRSIVRGAVLTGSYAIFSAEILSLASAITRGGLAAAWLLLLGAEAAWLVQRIRGEGALRLPHLSLPAGGFERLLLLAIVCIAVTIAVIAWYSPPNTWDSLNYHMARVAHWAQLRSVRHFATGIEHQNAIAPGAEMLVLHTYVLGGGDRWVNFVSWLAMAVSMVAASLVAAELGTKARGQILASVLVATLPMGIAEASSTMTDYVLGAWMLCVAAETLRLPAEERPRVGEIILGLAAGLAILTKPTAFAYLLPFAVWVGSELIRRGGLRRVARGALVAGAAVLLVNGGHWARNAATYGNPIGAGELMDYHSNELHTAGMLLSNLTRSAGMHAYTPWPALNRQVTRVVSKVHQLVGLDLNDPRTTSVPEFAEHTPAVEETRATNWYHAWLYLIVAASAPFGTRKHGWRAAVYTAAAVAGFVIFCYVFKWQVFSSRYHLPFFLLMAPAAAAIFTDRMPSWAPRLLGLAFIVACWPWLVRLENRPVLQDPNTGVSVLTEPRVNLLSYPGSGGGRRVVAERILAAGCSDVGIAISGGAAEYPFWVLLGAPRPDLRIEWIVGGTPSARLEDPSFQPCAVICDDSCPQEWTSIRGLTRLEEIGDLRLFLGPEAARVP